MNYIERKKRPLPPIPKQKAEMIPTTPNIISLEENNISYEDDEIIGISHINNRDESVCYVGTNNIDLESIIRKNRPNIGCSSVKTYMCSLRRIMKDTGLELKSPEDFIKNVDIILEKALEYTPSVRKSRLASIVVLLDDKGDYNNKDKNDAIKKLRVVMMKDSKTVDEEETKQELTEKQKENFLPQDEILNIYEVLKEQATPLFKLNQLNKRQFETMQLYVLLSLYVLIPPRRTMDYTHF